MLALAGVAAAGWTTAAHPVLAASGASGSGKTVADDGQATPKFVTDGSATGFRTADTIPWWGSSFTYNGTTYPYTMVGANPATNSSTTIPTIIIPLKFVFSPKSNLGGGNFSDVRDPYTVDRATGLNSVQGTLDSPVFQTATYPDNVGIGQVSAVGVRLHTRTLSPPDAPSSKTASYGSRVGACRSLRAVWRNLGRNLPPPLAAARTY